MCSQSILQRFRAAGDAGDCTANDPCSRPAGGSSSTSGIERLLGVASQVFDVVAADPDVRKTASLASILALGRSALIEAGTLLRAAAAPDGNNGPGAVDVRELLGRIGPLLRNVIRQNGRFSIDLCRHLPLVRCDAVALEGTIWSLIAHARRELQPGGDLRLKGARHAEQNRVTGARIEVCVALDPCCAETDPAQARSRDEIGLATATRFAKSVGGRIELNRSPTETLTIALWLPCCNPSPSAAGRGTPTLPSSIGPRDFSFPIRENDPCPKKH